MIQIHEEIDLMIQTVAEFIKYKNRELTYEQFVDNAVLIAKKSQLKQNLQWYNDTLMSWINQDPDFIKEQISDIDGLLNAINDVAKDIDQQKYQEAINYFNSQLRSWELMDGRRSNHTSIYIFHNHYANTYFHAFFRFILLASSGRLPSSTL